MRLVWTLVASVALAACGGSSGAPTQPPPPVPTTYRVTIGTDGVVSPTELVVPPGTRVLFANNHNVAHEITSDPHPEHDGCTELRQVGVLNPGQTKESGNLVTPRTCGYHDDTSFMNTAMQGRIVVR